MLTTPMNNYIVLVSKSVGKFAGSLLGASRIHNVRKENNSHQGSVESLDLGGTIQKCPDERKFAQEGGWEHLEPYILDPITVTQCIMYSGFLLIQATNAYK